MTNLLKKEEWEWTLPYQSSFEKRKQVVRKEPILALSDYSKPFKVHIDALNYNIEGVLMQDAYPIAYESCKLNYTERWYPMHDKEMTTIIYCLRV